MGRYSHPGIEEREDIMVRWRDHEGVSRIAREVGRDKSAVSREIARNGWAASASPRRVYRASTAQARADARRLACRRPRALGDPARRSLVASLIRDRHWSPEQVAGRMRAEAPSEAVSASTIRRAVGSGALDCELPGWQAMHGRRARTEDIDEGMAGGGAMPSPSFVPNPGTINALVGRNFSLGVSVGMRGCPLGG